MILSLYVTLKTQLSCITRLWLASEHLFKICYSFSYSVSYIK